MRREHARIIESGAGIAAVGMGEPAQVATFCAERELPFTCLADPGRRGYDAFGLAHGGPRELVGPKVLWRGLGVLRRGVSAGRPHSGQSARQMPGTFVVAADGTLRLAHYNADASDNPSMEQVLAALGL